MAVGLFATSAVCVADDRVVLAPSARKAIEFPLDRHEPILYRQDMFRTVGGTEIVLPSIAVETFDQRSLLRKPERSSAFMGQYRRALERETERSVDKDPSLYWLAMDEEEYPLPRLQRVAEKIFDGAHERLASRMLENLVSEARPLRIARDYIDGVQLDVLKGGGVDVGTFDRDDEKRQVSASFGLVVVGDPRIEMKTFLVSRIKTRMEIPLDLSGIRATMSKKLTRRIDGRLAAGVEDSGQDRWVLMALQVKF